MEEQLIIFKTAKLAKEKGFIIPVSKYYLGKEEGILKNNFEKFYGYVDGTIRNSDDFNENRNKKNWVLNEEGSECFGCKLDNKKYFNSFSAPSQSLLNKFIRETKGIHLTVERNASGWYWAMCQTDGGTSLGYSEFSGPNDGGVWESFEEAFENGLQTALIIKLEKFGHWSNFAMHAIKELMKHEF